MKVFIVTLRTYMTHLPEQSQSQQRRVQTRVRSRGDSDLLPVGMPNGTAPLTTIWRFPRKHILSFGVKSDVWEIYAQKTLLLDSYSSFTPNWQCLGATTLSFSGWLVHPERKLSTKKKGAVTLWGDRKGPDIPVIGLKKKKTVWKSHTIGLQI